MRYRASRWDVVGEHRYGIYVIADPRAAGVFVPVGADDRWLYARQPETPEEGLESYPPDVMTEYIRIGAGVPTLAPRVERIGRFSFAAQVARRYRAGRFFLAGDAAHRITPRGGTGMNTAIHDGHDLGWKLAWVLKGWAAPDLLDTYESERRPIGARNTARSADPQGSFRDVHERVAVDLGGRLPHLWLHRDGRQVSTLDVLGPGFTLLTDADGGGWRAAAAAAGSPVPIDVHQLDVVVAPALGIQRDGARLVRPDGTTAALWPTAIVDPAASLRRAVIGFARRSLLDAA